MKYRIKYRDLLIICLILGIGGYFLFSFLTNKITNDEDSLFTEEATAAVNSSPAEEATTISVSMLDDSIGLREQSILRIVIEPKTPIAGMQFDMSFDPTFVNVNTITEGDLFTQGGANTYFNPGVINNESGTITAVYGVIISPGEAVSTKGTFATIILTAGTTETICPITLSNVVVGDLEGNSVPVKVVNGELEISQS